MGGVILIPTVWCIAVFGVACFLLCGGAFLFFWNRQRRLLLREELLQTTADLEEQVEESRAAVKAKSDFLSKMSHEIRTPLNAIMGMTQIIRNTTDRDKINDCIEKMEESSQHLLGIINDILDLSKMESGNLVFEESLFSLTHEIEFVASMFRVKAAENGLSISSEVREIQHDGVITDKLRLSQVLINLMSNAVKFTDRGGSIELLAEEMFHLKGESVYRFTVRDNGIGIEPEQAKKLFTPFTQAHNSVARIYGGTGLGLAISQNIVQMMGGDIELATEYGKGSTFQFTIRVPAKEIIENQATDQIIEEVPLYFSGALVLVVDDNAMNLNVARGILKLYGIEVDTAESGKEALELVLKKPYDLVFMDQMMPEMDGVETTRELRALGITVTIIALTACAIEGQREWMMEAGMNDYLSKPVIVAELQQILRKWIPAEKIADPPPGGCFR